MWMCRQADTHVHKGLMCIPRARQVKDATSKLKNFACVQHTVINYFLHKYMRLTDIIKHETW